jgi:hypothetical protein
MAEEYTFAELCQALGKSTIYVRNIQKTLNLHRASNGQTYSEAYLAFMEGVIALRTFTVPLEQIEELFKKELKILRLLHVDSMSDSPTWYLDSCHLHRDREGRLLLTGHELGFSEQGRAIQANLDFHTRPAELFKSREMGEDVRVVLKHYLDQMAKIRARVLHQKGVLKNALAWCRQFVG